MGIQEKERDALFDNMKALLIFLVVLGHLIRDFGYDTELGNSLYKIIFSFHMPAFLFVSGYFAKYNPKRFFAKMIPLYVVFQCLHYLLDLVVILLHGGNISSIHFQMFTPRFTLWYLMALMAYQLLIPVIDTSDGRHRALIFTAAVAAGLLMGLNPDSHNFMAMSRIVTFFPFFLLGYYEKDAQWIRNLRERCHRRMGVVSVFLTAALIIGFCVLHNTISSGWFLATKSYGDHGFTWYIRLAVYGIALVWILILMMLIPGRKIPFLGQIGRNTLPVYLIHAIIVPALSSSSVVVSWLTGRMVMILILAAGMTWIFSRNVFQNLVNKIQLKF